MIIISVIEMCSLHNLMPWQLVTHFKQSDRLEVTDDYTVPLQCPTIPTNDHSLDPPASHISWLVMLEKLVIILYWNMYT